MANLPRFLAHVLTVVLCAAFPVEPLGAATYRVAETLFVDTVPSWFPVGFCLLTHDTQQFVAYYDQEHQMTVARRRLDERAWQTVTLPSRVGWDSHNGVTMAVDAEGHLHLSGNMHGAPLVYFRTQTPGDITSFTRHAMTGREELHCTYPVFLNDADGNLLFLYRSGGSGNGRRLCNTFDVDSTTWTRFLDTPLFDGEGQRNAYPQGPNKGPDGLFHVVWVWRDTPDCATNHHVSYARSRDLKRWETAEGNPVALPLTLGQSELCVDPIPSGGGIINGCEKITFDAEQRPILSYHKLDDNGHMQIYVARFQDGQWEIHPITQWEKNIAFSGGGAMPFIGIKIGPLEPLEPGMFSIRYRHRDYGSGRIFLDASTLRPVDREMAVPREYPAEVTKPTIAFAGIGTRIAADLGESGGPHQKFVLRWETLAPHHDRPRKPPLPPPSRLQLVKLVKEE